MRWTFRVFWTVFFLFSPIVSTWAGMIFEEKKAHTKAFHSYWYEKGAEISRFDLARIQYGQKRRGHAVLIFVTESLDPETHIKADAPDAGDIPILKLNKIKNFITGVYPYSVMTSVFSPIDFEARPFALKISASVQEWCGHTYLQMNLEKNRYQVQRFSYFEKDGNTDQRIQKCFTEDGVFTQIRLAPSRLFQGEGMMIPAATDARFAHRPLVPRKVTARLIEDKGLSLGKKPLVRYTLHYPEINRRFDIWFERNFPNRIEKWTETIDANTQTTAVCTHRMMIDYWNYNKNEHLKIREQLKVGGKMWWR